MSENTCRICLGGAEPDDPLFTPCKCTGTMGFVHKECLFDWTKHQFQYQEPQDYHRCALCGTRFRYGTPPKFHDRIQWKYNADCVRYLVDTCGSAVFWAAWWVIAVPISTHLAVASAMRIARLDLSSEIFQNAFWCQLSDPWIVARGLSAMFFKGLGEAAVLISLFYATTQRVPDFGAQFYASPGLLGKDDLQEFMIDGKMQGNLFLVLTDAEMFAEFSLEFRWYTYLETWIYISIFSYYIRREYYEKVLKFANKVPQMLGIAFVSTIVSHICCSAVVSVMRWLIFTLISKLLTAGETSSALVAKLNEWSTLKPLSFLQFVALGLPVSPIIVNAMFYYHEQGLKPNTKFRLEICDNRAVFVTTTACWVVMPYLHGMTLYYVATGTVTNPGLSRPLGMAFWLVGGLYAIHLDDAFDYIGAMFRRMKFQEDVHDVPETEWGTKDLSHYLSNTATRLILHMLVLCSLSWGLHRLGLMVLKLSPEVVSTEVAAALFRPLDLTLPSLNVYHLRWIMLTVSTLLTLIEPEYPSLARVALYWLSTRVWLRATTLVVRGMSHVKFLPQPDVPPDYKERKYWTTPANPELGRHKYGPNWFARELLLLVSAWTLVVVLGIAPLLAGRAGCFVVYGEHMAPDILLWATSLALELPVVGWLLLKTQPLELKRCVWVRQCRAALNQQSYSDRRGPVLTALAFVIVRFCVPHAWAEAMTWAVPNLIFRVVASTWPVEWYACALPLFLALNVRGTTELLQLPVLLVLSKDLYLPQVFFAKMSRPGLLNYGEVNFYAEKYYETDSEPEFEAEAD